MKKVLTGILGVLIIIGSFVISPSYAAEFYEEEFCTFGIVAGDATNDSKLNAKDATRILNYLAGYDVKINSYAGDADMNQKITVTDAVLILRYLAGWRNIRLCHNDTKEIVTAATEEDFGLMKMTCSVCQNSEDALLPRVGQSEYFEIKGVPLSEYTIVYGECTGTDDLLPLANMLRSTLNRIAEVDLYVKRATDEPLEHEIIIGNCNRDVLPEFEEGVPAAGICEDGTVYFYAYTMSATRYLIDTFMDEAFGTPFCDSFGATLGRTDILANPWGNDCDEWSWTSEELDLEAEGYKLVFEDNFDGDALDMDVWMHRAPGQRRDGVNDPNMVVVEDGTLKIKGEYVVDGPYGDKWHAGMIALNEWYARGYYEIRAKCADSSYGFWSAFWIQGAAPYDAEQSQGGPGPGGAELDILENNCTEGYTRHNVYCAGVTGVPEIDGATYSAYEGGQYYIGDIENEYHTYALEWDEDWYTFYVDGIMVGRTNYGDGTGISPEQIIISLEIGTNMPKPEDANFEELKEQKTEYVVDYIRIYQK